MPSFRAVCKFIVFILWSFLVIPPQIIILLFHKGSFAYFLPHIWHKGVCRIFGLKVILEGTPVRDKQTIYVGNHMSYFDIIVIGSILQGSFVSKAEATEIPVFGLLPRLQQTAFISRSKTDAEETRGALNKMVTEGKSLIIFPEGTSTDGREVLPFKSSLFALALRDTHTDMLVQPFTIIMEEVDGRPITTQQDRDLYAWHLHMTIEMPPHLWLFAKSSGATIRIKFHVPFHSSEHADRKALAKLCHDSVSKGLGPQPEIVQAAE